MDLKPCPFCGGAAEVKSSRVPTAGGSKSYMRGWVGCKACGAYMQWTYEPSFAVRKWNQRKGDGHA